MSRPRCSSLSLLAVLCLVVAPVAALAQTVPAECKPVIDAERNVITTPHHTYSTEAPSGQNAAAVTGETVSTDGVNYVLYKGKWRRSPMTAQMQLDQMQENISNTKVFTCRREGDESVGGMAAAVYTTHSESEEIKSDARTWVAKSSGLPLRTEEDIDTGGGDKRHISIRYEYTNVRAPAVD